MTGILEVNKLSKRFCRDPNRAALYTVHDIVNDVTLRGAKDKLRAGEFWALRDIDFRVNAGEVIGVIGNNGAGKSTLLSLVTGILRPTAGRITLNARNVVTMGNQTDLNPVQTGRENIVNKLALYGMPGKSIAENIGPVMDFADLGDAIDSPAGTYSLGMRVRLSFAIYTQLRPDLLIVDEGLNGGDINFHRKFGSFIEEYISAGGTILLASHNIPLVQLICHRCVLIERGEVVAIGDAREVIDTYHQLNEKDNHAQSSLTGRAENSSWSDYFSDDVSSGPVHFESVTVSDPNGTCIIPGGTAVFEIVCYSREDIPAAICGLEIGSVAIFPLAVLFTQHSFKQGRNVLRCTVDKLPLIPGIYNVALCAANSKVGSILGFKGYTDRPFEFSVTSEPDELNNVARFKNSPLLLSASWSVNG